MKLKLKGRHFESTEKIQIKLQDIMKMMARIYDPTALPITEILLGLLHQCRRGLLQRGWRRKEILVSS